MEMRLIARTLAAPSFRRCIPWILAGAPLFLTLLGFRLLFEYESRLHDGSLDGIWQGLESQITAGIIGVVLAVLIAAFSLHRVFLSRPFIIFGFVLLVTLIILTFIPNAFVEEINGVRRWVSLGSFSVQPSEFIKVFVVAALAYFVGGYRTRKHLYHTLLWGVAGLFVLCVALMFAQSHFGLMSILCVVFAVLIPWRLFWRKSGRVIMVLAGFAVSGCVIALVSVERLRNRLLTLFDANPYHLEKNIDAIASGGWRGAEEMYPTYTAVPEQVTDSIFALLSYEFGSVMSITVIIVFGILLLAGMSISLHARSANSLLALGLVVLLAAQVSVNIFFSLFLTLTGEVLPFISKGGSALIAMYMVIGLLYSVHRSSGGTEST